MACPPYTSLRGVTAHSQKRPGLPAHRLCTAIVSTMIRQTRLICKPGLLWIKRDPGLHRAPPGSLFIGNSIGIVFTYYVSSTTRKSTTFDPFLYASPVWIGFQGNDAHSLLFSLPARYKFAGPA